MVKKLFYLKSAIYVCIVSLMCISIIGCQTTPVTHHYSKHTVTSPSEHKQSKKIASKKEKSNDHSLSPQTTKQFEKNQTIDIWDRLTQQTRFTDCNVMPSTPVWRARYTANPQYFEQSLQRILPQLTYVLEVFEKYNIPSEFALLPFVESEYRAIQARGNRPAGMWQLMPITAKHYGLEVSSYKDDRLNIFAATEAAAQLLLHLNQEFNGDWILTNMAYNTGEFRVKKALKRYQGADHTIAYGKLPVSRITREHTAKLMALSCIVADPTQYHVQLPIFDHTLDYKEILLAQQTKQNKTTFNNTQDPYLVRKGDSLWLIAKRFGTTITKLLHTNQLTADTTLMPGQKLLLN